MYSYLYIVILHGKYTYIYMKSVPVRMLGPFVSTWSWWAPLWRKMVIMVDSYPHPGPLIQVINILLFYFSCCIGGNNNDNVCTYAADYLYYDVDI